MPPGSAEPAAPQTDPGEPTEGKPSAPADFSALLKDKAFAAEFDKRVEKALGTARANFEADAQKRIDEARAEGEKAAQMTADERAKADEAKRTKALAEREAKLLAGEFRAAAVMEMGEKKLPASLCKLLDYIDAKHHGDEKARQTIVAALEEAHREGVQAGVDARLKPGEQPKDTQKGASPDENLAKQMGGQAAKTASASNEILKKYMEG